MLAGEFFPSDIFQPEELGIQESFAVPNPFQSLTGHLLVQSPYGQNSIGSDGMELNRKGGKNQRPKIRPSKAKKPLPVPRREVPTPVTPTPRTGK